MSHFLKNCLRWLFIVPLMTGLTACDDLLEVSNSAEIPIENAFASPEAIELQLMGVYEFLQGTPLFGTNLVMGPDLMVSWRSNSLYLDWRGTFNSYREINFKGMTPTNADVVGVWTNAYRAINRVNLILANLDVVTDESQRDRIEAEARLLRGVLYFELVKLYGRQYDASATTNPGVVLVTDPVPTIASEVLVLPPVARSTVDQVYAQVISDITFGRDNLPDLNTAGGLPKQFRMGSLTASGYLARVYLQRNQPGDFDLAGAEAHRVIESEAFTLDTNSAPIDPFTIENFEENIWEIQQNELSNAGTSNGGLATFYNTRNRGGRGDCEVGFLFAAYAGYESGDIRNSEQENGGFFYEFNEDDEYFVRCGKWNSPTSNYVMMRLAEMYLIRAECRTQGYNPGDGLTVEDDLNIIRARAGLVGLTPGAGTTREEVLLERIRELCYEGQEFWTMRRYGSDNYFNIDGDAGAIDFIPVGDFSLLFPIPQREIDVNPLLVQNTN